MSGISKLWKESASVIVVSKSVFSNCHQAMNMKNIDKNYNYKLLVMKRSLRNTYMPSTYVFPGGLIDTTDQSDHWLDLYKQMNVNFQELQSVSCDKDFVKFSCFGKEESKTSISPLLSLKITAIRETFEECGLLLCRSKNVHLNEMSRWGSFLTGHDLQSWQHTVKDNPTEFINLCKTLECCPDVWALHSWSNWLTPTYYKRRFNTAFFLVILDQMPPVYVDNNEVSEIRWDTPEGLLESSRTEELVFPIPQLYELSKLTRFNNIESLFDYITEHNTCHTKTCMPVHIQLEDGKVSLFPGDYMYPNEPKYYSSQPIEQMKTRIEDIRDNKKKMNRIENFDKKDWNVITNYEIV